MAKRVEAEAIEETEVSGETIADRVRSYLSEVRALAADYIDASEEFANKLLDLQSRSTSWAKETLLARVFEGQNSLGRRLVEVSARAARALWRVGAEEHATRPEP